MDNRVTDTTALREIYRQPSKLVAGKNVPAIDTESARFLARSPLCVLATHGPGGADASPRGGPAGFARVLDDGTRLAFGDLSGNNRLDSYTNFLDNPQIGLIFFVPGSDHTVRVNGTASLTTDPDICAAATVGDRVPKTAVVVDVNECFLHCGKALLRANIWDTSTWPESEVPTAGEILAAQHELQAEPEDIDRNLEAGYAATLWVDAGS
ncbi:MSMEG_1061 family FMN-dependent PPOX-type flavoprotein [Candidatus Poriferisodalis sp.]|uniref:MSMEG_1061 family FMN-dependent PPOX-type flavoprotein n=1 Tax=Candidatus Poriferisodalis sp. TaxID=3101277 RepID=UPI003B0248DE